MKTTLKTYTVEELLEGFVFDKAEGKGLYGLNGKLVIQPEYQRHYIYDEGNKDKAVIASLLDEYPLGLLYFNDNGEMLEVLDGQQRITSIGRFITGKFAIKRDGVERTYKSLPENLRKRLVESTLLVYECKGSESDIKSWFETINIAGIPLNRQELLNALYSGPYVTEAKAEFSNSNNSNLQKWSAYVKGLAKRQEILEVALKWVSESKGKKIDQYLADHRKESNIDELKTYFNSVIDWIDGVFTSAPDKVMQGLDWGRLYREYHSTPYDTSAIAVDVADLLADPAVKNPKGIYEYLLGKKKDPSFLDVRLFDEKTKRLAYKRQTDVAQPKGISNCPMCSIGTNANRIRIYRKDEMEADHVTAWSKGGKTDLENCEMLCVNHNRQKGNK